MGYSVYLTLSPTLSRTLSELTEFSIGVKMRGPSYLPSFAFDRVFGGPTNDCLIPRTKVSLVTSTPTMPVATDPIFHLPALDIFPKIYRLTTPPLLPLPPPSPIAPARRRHRLKSFLF